MISKKELMNPLTKNSVIAISVLIITIIVLVIYFGFLPQEQPMPGRCNFPTVFNCIDWKINANGERGADVWFTLVNGAGKDIQISSMILKSTDVSFMTNSCELNGSSGTNKGFPATSVSTAYPIVIKSNSVQTLKATCPTEGAFWGKDRNRIEKKKYLIDVTYMYLDSPDKNHFMQGELLTRMGN